jgi:multicomponent Na+:H+ antiporter subunit G
MSGVVTAVLMLLGSAFCLLGAVGMLRMPDLFTRLQAATKTGTLGVGCIMVGVAVHFGELGIAARSLLVVVFLFLTAPIAAHVIARAAYFVSVPLWSRTAIDELKEAMERRGGAAPAESKAPASHASSPATPPRNSDA